MPLKRGDLEEVSSERVLNQEKVEEEHTQEADELADQKVLISEAKKEAALIIENAMASSHSILKKAELEAEEIKNKAKEEGFQKGYDDGKLQIDQLQQNLEEQIKSNAKEHQEILEDIEPKFADLVVRLVEKMTGVVSAEYKTVILHLIQNSLKENDNANQYLIRVSREDYDTVKKKVDSLKAQLKEDVSFELVMDNQLKKTECFIETDASVIDLSLEEQLKNLITDVRLLAEQSM